MFQWERLKIKNLRIVIFNTNNGGREKDECPDLDKRS